VVKKKKKGVPIISSPGPRGVLCQREKMEGGIYLRIAPRPGGGGGKAPLKKKKKKAARPREKPFQAVTARRGVGEKGGEGGVQEGEKRSS